MNEQFTFFWHGPFSQWHPSEFEIDGIKYVNAEQFMMASKARMFGDEEIYEKIMSTKSPREQKKLGRKVKNFDQALWSVNAIQVVHIGNVAKFSQNEDLKQALLATGTTTLVEASPYDKIWGIGLLESDERALKRDTWLGTNLLGEVLTKVRNELK